MASNTRLRSLRSALGVSQTRLARLARISRFKLCLYELGDGTLNLDELLRIQQALQAEADRLRSIPAELDLAALHSNAPEVGV